MDKNRYLDESHILKDFFSFYCKHKHKDKQKNKLLQTLKYNEEEFEILELDLCDECASLYKYANKNLNECEKIPKPKCRECKTRCYDDSSWKKMANVMRYSGIRLGYIKIKKRLNPFKYFQK